MAEAKLTAVSGSMVELKQLCDHYMCSCKKGFGDRSPNLLRLGKTQIVGAKMSTPLFFSENGGQEIEQSVPGVVTTERAVEGFNACEGPIITSSGIVCGAIDSLRRNRK